GPTPITATRWVRHPGYNESDYNTWENDIGIIVIGSDVINFNSDNVQEICLPQDDINTDGQVMRVAGWGNTQRYGSLSFNSVLREASVLGANSMKPRSTFPIGSSIAALPLSGFVSVGDSGGPVMLNRNNWWTIVGVIQAQFLHNRAQNCDPSCPLFFTRVSQHLGWINEVIDENTFENTLPLPFLYNVQDSSLNSSHSNNQRDDENDEIFSELNENLRLLEAYLRKNKHDELK
ncbi:chymotrypsinogen B-like protein, partial [Dinothrombium tinctorium]